MDKRKFLLDTAKEMCQPKTDTAVAARVGVTKSAVSLWRKGGAISEKHLAALASVAQLDGRIVLEIMEAEAETRQQKEIWRSLLARIGTAAAALAFVVIGSAFSPNLYAKSFANNALIGQGIVQADYVANVHYVQ